MNLPIADDALASRLSQVRDRILQRSRATLEEAAGLLSAAERGELAPDERERAYILIHNLAGVAGSVGLTEVGLASKALDQILRPWLRGDQATPQWRSAFDDLITACQAAQSGSL